MIHSNVKLKLFHQCREDCLFDLVVLIINSPLIFFKYQEKLTEVDEAVSTQLASLYKNLFILV